MLPWDVDEAAQIEGGVCSMRRQQGMTLPFVITVCAQSVPAAVASREWIDSAFRLACLRIGARHEVSLCLSLRVLVFFSDPRRRCLLQAGVHIPAGALCCLHVSH